MCDATMRIAMALLAELRHTIPPDVGNHALVLTADDRLCAMVRHHRMGQSFFFEEADLDRDPADLAAEMKSIIERNFSKESI